MDFAKLAHLLSISKIHCFQPFLVFLNQISCFQSRDRSGSTAVCAIITPTHVVIANLGSFLTFISLFHLLKIILYPFFHPSNHYHLVFHSSFFFFKQISDSWNLNTAICHVVVCLSKSKDCRIAGDSRAVLSRGADDVFGTDDHKVVFWFSIVVVCVVL